MSPSSKGVAITKSDSTDLTGIKQLYVGTTGDVAVRLTRDPGNTLVIPTVPAGTILKLSITRVMAASTAAGFVGFY
jgi:hypothetical protein